MTLLDTRTLPVARLAPPDRFEVDAVPALVRPAGEGDSRPHGAPRDHDPATCGPDCGHDHAGPALRVVDVAGPRRRSAPLASGGAVVRIAPSLLRLGLGGRLLGAAVLSAAIWTMILRVIG